MLIFFISASELQLQLSSIIPSEDLLNKYYRYDGSLTTPPCSEEVTWNFFNRTINISEKQVISIIFDWKLYVECLFFLKMETFLTNKVKRNFRNPMPLNSRKVFRSFIIEELDEINVSSQMKSNCYLMVIVSIILTLVLIWQKK